MVHACRYAFYFQYTDNLGRKITNTLLQLITSVSRNTIGQIVITANDKGSNCTNFVGELGS